MQEKLSSSKGRIKFCFPVVPLLSPCLALSFHLGPFPCFYLSPTCPTAASCSGSEGQTIECGICLRAPVTSSCFLSSLVSSSPAQLDPTHFTLQGDGLSVPSLGSFHATRSLHMLFPEESSSPTASTYFVSYFCACLSSPLRCCTSWVANTHYSFLYL